MAIIGRATIRSAPGIARVHVDTWRDTYAGLLPDRVLVGMSYERQASDWAWQIRKRADSQPVILAAEIGHGVVGFTSFGACREADKPPSGAFADTSGASAVGEVFTLYVRPDFQARGTGRRLLAAAFSTLAEHGFARAFVWVLRDNTARFFYQRMGGIEIGARRERLWGCEVDETAYGWPDLKRALSRIGSCSAGQ
ncbi:MAG: GNAT family N-acetyltransferase [Pseudomonadota bacterium]